jgi:hypothetical protein
MTRAIVAIVLVAGVLVLRVPASAVASAQTDLDAFMQQVLARRDDNWKKLQQYILDEREQIEVRGPARVPLWGQRRDYTWYIRDGFFVRSPVKFDGVTISEADRRKYESDYLKKVQARDARRGGAGASTPPQDATEAPTDVAGLIRQSREPEFISSAYFMRFRFDAGTYALVGREQLDGREVLRIEYYPTNLFRAGREGRDQKGREGQEGQKGRERKSSDDLMLRLLNKVALVTMWIEPTSHQIVKSTFDNVTFDFLPGQWLVRVEDVTASMSMGQPFPDVWLPRSVEMKVAMELAMGQVDLRYALDYHDYRLADATVLIR